MSAESSPPVRCTGWMGEAEAALSKLKDLWQRPSSEWVDKWNRGNLADVICDLQEIIDSERSPSSIDPKLSDCGGRRGSCMAGARRRPEAATVTHGAVRCSE